MDLTHINTSGKATMVDVSDKPIIKRTAIAYGKIKLQKKTLELLNSNLLKKGDALSVSKIAGILAAKKTPDLIPLCHPIMLDNIDLGFNIVDDGIEIKSYVIVAAKTGVEMEALTAVSIAALNIYDMCKAVDKDMTIENIHLVEKKKEIISQ